MDQNARAKERSTPRRSRASHVQSALLSAARAEELGMALDRLILSPRSPPSGFDRGLCRVARRSDYALHLGLTEAEWAQAACCLAAAIGVLATGIGDTIRISLTPDRGGDRTREVQVARSCCDHGLRTFVPLVAACPGCADHFEHVQELASEVQDFIRDPNAEWKSLIPVPRGYGRGHGLHRHGPGERKHADIGISLPGTGEQPAHRCSWKDKSRNPARRDIDIDFQAWSRIRARRWPAARRPAAE